MRRFFALSLLAVVSVSAQQAENEGAVQPGNEKTEEQLSEKDPPPAGNDDTSTEPGAENWEDDLFYGDEDENNEEIVKVSDPLEPVNRPIFVFNDFVFRYMLEPVARGYSWVVPEFMRKGVSNAFSNIYTPIRLVNSTLQFKWGGAGRELGRFAINTTVGVGGLWDPARDLWQIQKSDEDFGQTLGVWGLGPGIHLQVPFLGPMNPRDLTGFVADTMLKPETYVGYYLYPDSYVKQFAFSSAVYTAYAVNETSLRPGEYEELGENAIDRYSFYRDVYFQYRARQVEK